MKIFLMGQCSLHWGRMEFGNIGNYYILEPFIQQLHSTFGPGLTITTTFQLSDEFNESEGVTKLPMDLYYGWKDDDLDVALEELEIARTYSQTAELTKETAYIKEILSSDLVIDFSGDIWGDNANLLGPNRFMVGLCKDRVAQLLNRPTFMLAGSPGPFENSSTLIFAKEVFENFTAVTNREANSTEILKDMDFNVQNVKTLACPAFLFEPTEQKIRKDNLKQIDSFSKNKKRPLVGFILCGWNFTNGPFDLWPRDDNDYTVFAEAIESIGSKLNVDICLMSHSNGFPVPPEPFILEHGRDYPIIKQLQAVLNKRGKIDSNQVLALDGVYNAWETKKIVGSFDMLISGRIHAAVAGLSQFVPTVIIDYGHEPKAHKLRGFAEVAGMSEYVADPNNAGELIYKIEKCWEQRKQLREKLVISMPKVRMKAKQNFSILKQVFQK